MVLQWQYGSTVVVDGFTVDRIQFTVDGDDFMVTEMPKKLRE
jgi:hypothetical protein